MKTPVHSNMDCASDDPPTNRPSHLRLVAVPGLAVASSNPDLQVEGNLKGAATVGKHRLRLLPRGQPAHMGIHKS